jgi:hypothetical protein
MLDLQRVAVGSAGVLYIQLKSLHVPGVPPSSRKREQLAHRAAQYDEVAQASKDFKHAGFAASIPPKQKTQVARTELEVHQRAEVVRKDPLQHRRDRTTEAQENQLWIQGVTGPPSQLRRLLE